MFGYLFVYIDYKHTMCEKEHASYDAIVFMEDIYTCRDRNLEGGLVGLALVWWP